MGSGAVGNRNPKGYEAGSTPVLDSTKRARIAGLIEDYEKKYKRGNVRVKIHLDGTYEVQIRNTYIPIIEPRFPVQFNNQWSIRMKFKPEDEYV